MNWGIEEFSEACLILSAESGYHVEESEIQEDLEDLVMSSKGIILDRLAEDFAACTAEELFEQGYSAEQIPYIEGELTLLGLSLRKSDKAKKQISASSETLDSVQT